MSRPAPSRHLPLHHTALTPYHFRGRILATAYHLPRPCTTRCTFTFTAAAPTRYYTPHAAAPRLQRCRGRNKYQIDNGERKKATPHTRRINTATASLSPSLYACCMRCQRTELFVNLRMARRDVISFSNRHCLTCSVGSDDVNAARSPALLYSRYLRSTGDARSSDVTRNIPTYALAKQRRGDAVSAKQAAATAGASSRATADGRRHARAHGKTNSSRSHAPRAPGRYLFSNAHLLWHLSDRLPSAWPAYLRSPAPAALHM